MIERKLQVERSQLKGTVHLSGAKNSALRLQAASILTDEDVTLTNFPNKLSDVVIHNEMLEYLGKKICVDDNRITISGSVDKTELIWNKRSIRNNLLIWGALLARKGYSKVPLPGGCAIGERKYDLHQMVLESLGARVWVEDEYLCASIEGKLIGNDIHLPLRSTGATENAIIASSLAEGKTIIWNPHIRPEILDLIDMLNKMGAKIEVNGNESIVVTGVERLYQVEHEVITDNMEALTFAVAAAITNGDVEIIGFPKDVLEVPLIFLKSSGLNIFEGKKSVIIRGSRVFPLEISTGTYPGINSDMQPLFAVFASQARGLSKIVDLRFPDRFDYAKELEKIGVDTHVENNLLIINGGSKTVGTNVFADDLRAGAALLLAGLISNGTTIIHNASQIERGYNNFLEKFVDLGAKIRWIE